MVKKKDDAIKGYLTIESCLLRVFLSSFSLLSVRWLFFAQSGAHLRCLIHTQTPTRSHSTPKGQLKSQYQNILHMAIQQSPPPPPPCSQSLRSFLPSPVLTLFLSNTDRQSRTVTHPDTCSKAQNNTVPAVR